MQEGCANFLFGASDIVQEQVTSEDKKMLQSQRSKFSQRSFKSLYYPFSVTSVSSVVKKSLRAIYEGTISFFEPQRTQRSQREKTQQTFH